MPNRNVINPFHRVYYAEGIGEVDIPSVFSPKLVPYVSQLFLPGNVVLRGMEGTGKTMLLSLLDTKVRLAFWEHPDAAPSGELSKGDPLTASDRRFVGAGINLSSSKAFKLNEIRVSQDREENIQLSRQYFGDFVNAWIVRDLFSSIRTLISTLRERRDFERLDQIGLPSDLRGLNAAVRLMTKDTTCAFLAGAKTVEELRRNLGERISAYLQLVSDPRSVLPAEINSTRRLLGVPITAATQALKSRGILAADTNVFVTIDQFEQLVRRSPLDGDDQKNLRFIHEIEDLLGLRVPDVSYRIGTRPNARLTRCDANRDYLPLDLDLILRRKEGAGSATRRSLIYEFAQDAFRRRIAMSDLPSKDEIVADRSPLKLVYGKSPQVAERGRLCQPKKRERVLRLPKEWPAEVKAWLQRLAREDVIAGSLGEAWVRQQAAKNAPLDAAIWDAADTLPWEAPSKKWWKKERLPLASLHVAARNAQRLVYFGESDVIQLSGDNIVAIISICREIWECNARYQVADAEKHDDTVLRFDRKRQSEGIRDASRIWRDKMKERPNGDTMQRFVDELGSQLHKRLIKDRQMSYPGANGISLAESDLASDRDLARLLDDATAECFLLQREHTPKHPTRGKSIKWYLHPILAPFYQLTMQHTKEPLYLTAKKLRGWMETCGVLAHRSDTSEVSATDVQMPMKPERRKASKNEVTKAPTQKTLWPEGE